MPFKIPVLIIICWFCLSFNTYQKINLSLEDAVQKHYIKINIQGVENSTHFYEPVSLDIRNISDKAISLTLPTGTLLTPTDTSIQTLIVTEKFIANLNPKQSLKVNIKAMCTQSYKTAGDAESIYNLTINSNIQLIDLAKFIEKNKYFNSCGQSAVWALINKNDLSSVFGSDTLAQKTLRLYLHQKVGLKMPTKAELNDYRYNYYIDPNPSITLGGYFQFGLKRPHDIQVALFNDQNILVRELYNKKAYLPQNGEKINYAFDFTVYKEDTYYIKLLVDNRVTLSKKVNAKSIRDEYLEKMKQRQQRY